ncbi:hypothetical protein IGI04_023458 [Brassica rapa subsp. trilocularis]|uniref:Uncharacterized protein n=1 Tax=Brassica rapa subsp. trilocularis TaxID=1813537 RepID=A0ABQ7M3X8_BRACM|nr:hypothetical protein IGI04_023458 [Brassica rapa subsp. trilocularis]
MISKPPTISICYYDFDQIHSKLCRDLERLGNSSRQASLFPFISSSLTPISLSSSLFSFRWISSSLLAASSPRASRAAGGGGGDRPSVVMWWLCSGGGDQISISSPLSLVSRSRSRSKLRWSVLNPSCSHSHEWFVIKARMLEKNECYADK